MKHIKKQIDFDKEFENACAQSGIILDKRNASERAVKIKDAHGKIVTIKRGADALAGRATGFAFVGHSPRTYVTKKAGSHILITEDEQETEKSIMNMGKQKSSVGIRMMALKRKEQKKGKIRKNEKKRVH